MLHGKRMIPTPYAESLVPELQDILAARGKSRASTETGEAPGWQGARRENIGNIRPTSNAVSRDASPVECRGTFATGC